MSSFIAPERGRALARGRVRIHPVDAHVVLLARQRGWRVLSSAADDLLAIDSSLEIERL